MLGWACPQTPSRFKTKLKITIFTLALSPVIRSRQPEAWPRASLPAAGNGQLPAKHQHLCTDDMQQEENKMQSISFVTYKKIYSCSLQPGHDTGSLLATLKIASQSATCQCPTLKKITFSDFYYQLKTFAI